MIKLLKAWWRKPFLEKVVLATIFTGFFVYGSTKPTPPSINVYTDEYVTNNGSYLTNGNETFYAKWTYSSQVPPTALIHIAVRDKGQEEAVWEDIAFVQVGLLEAEIYIGEGGDQLDYFLYVDYVPPAPVHTNGVYMFYVEQPKGGTSNRWITIKSEVRKDNIKIMPHPREER